MQLVWNVLSILVGTLLVFLLLVGIAFTVAMFGLVVILYKDNEKWIKQNAKIVELPDNKKLLLMSFEDISECISYLIDIDYENAKQISYVYNISKEDSYIVEDKYNSFILTKINSDGDIEYE